MTTFQRRKLSSILQKRLTDYGFTCPHSGYFICIYDTELWQGDDD